MRNRVFIILLMIIFVLPSTSMAVDRIISGANAISWLMNNGYINSGGIPQQKFNVFRSQVLGGGVGPSGLKAIMAGGWSLTGPMTTPIREPVVIIVDDASLTPDPLLGKTVAPSCSEYGFTSACTTTVFKIGSTFVCAWDKGGCNDSVFTIQNIIGNKVEMYRADQTCPISPGLTATYSGTLSGRTLSGKRTILGPGSRKPPPVAAGNVAPFTCSF